MRRSCKISNIYKLLHYCVKLTFLIFESLGGKKILSYVSHFLDFFFFFFLNLFQNKNTMVTSKMGLLRRTANWNL